MSLFDSIFSEYNEYVLEDNNGDDDENDDNPDSYKMDDENNEDQPQEGTDNEEPDTDDNPDDYNMSDDNQEEGEGGDETQPEPQQAIAPEDTDNDDNPDDYNMDGGEEGEPESQADDEGDQSTGEEPDANGDENDPNEDNPDDYSMDGDQGGEDTGGDQTNNGQDDTGGGEGYDTQDDMPQEGDYQEPSSKLQDLQKSIFDQLSPEQQNLKIKELKSLYDDVYNKCSKILDIVVSAEKIPSQTKVYDYITNSVVDLQKYIKDYLQDIFDSKTYIDNMTELQKYMAILDTINNVFEELKKNNEKEFKD